jgi:NAD+ synthase (glutamine-hydrolysing)
MKIALAQLNYHIGNFASNGKKIIDNIQKAKKEGADLVVFAELSISGYPPRDFLEFDDFINKCFESTLRIAKETNGIAVIMGLPTKNTAPKGKPLFNSAVFIENGKIIQYRHKSLLPNYDIFDEYRYFEPNRDFKCINFKGAKIALTICEDLWNIGDDPLYTLNPMDILVKEKPYLIINIAASPFHYDQRQIRIDILKRNVEKYKIPLFYVNHVGAQTELLFDGGSLVLNKQAQKAGELKYFEEDFKIFDTNALFARPVQVENADKIGLIHDALVMGIKNYFDKLGFEKAILGLSGGIDSAVTMALACRALGTKNVLSVLLPSQYSSNHSISDARELANNLNAPYEIIPIEHIYKAFDKELRPHFKELPFGIAEENIQARARGVLLMALSNKFGYILLNTSNKSEAAVGYGTLYGDMNGGLAVIGDVYKSDVFALAKYINNDLEIIPQNTIDKPPSAELRPDQKDADSLPEYPILDEILYQYIEKRQGPKELIAMGFDDKLVNRILKLVNSNEYKRYQTPPILRISAKAFGMGRRMPIVAKYLS